MTGCNGNKMANVTVKTADGQMMVVCKAKDDEISKMSYFICHNKLCVGCVYCEKFWFVKGAR